MTLSRWILLVAMVGIFILVGMTVFVPIQNMIRTIIPPNSSDSPIVAVGRAAMPYILVIALFYGAYRLWKARGQS
jgi:uncharacterized membrane protein YdbT with pleckstrin-like domain